MQIRSPFTETGRQRTVKVTNIRMLPLFFFCMLFGFLMPSLSDALELEFSAGRIRATGAIVAGDAARFAAAVEQLSSKGTDFSVSVDSNGGSVNESIAIGRILRKNKIKFILPLDAKCFSSCALILAGAVERQILTSDRKTPASGIVGIHRPYLADARGVGNFDKLYKDTQVLVSSYLREMNISQDITEIMFSTPPEKMFVLRGSEAYRYFPESDPAHEEEIIASAAAEIGISSAEFRQRGIRASSICSHFDVSWRKLMGKELLSGDDEVLARAHLRLEIHCTNAILRDMDIVDYIEKLGAAKSYCDMPEKFAKKCILDQLRK